MESRLSGLQDRAKPRLSSVGGPVQPEGTACLFTSFYPVEARENND